ncbi:uncharacterized protein CC84DRAFT_1168772 [Paraphaeosphaeria sporulosa]|uniref:Uncharacterized protein n=1 Tax=Paraphaeosphaeria sporulosa TaxID=1460663 RepID=A0A177BZU1_9PLEO|nr:uncharacterized protein CC84DRAFT_1168772 [Paraphaeosphaeria sporulosa]OAG00735.1 hypothetical protein CC84DRAFT_1168772 [Paraphaeosphaeria sporulosa]
MCVIFGAGADLARRSKVRDVQKTFKTHNYAVAILQVLYSFQGWENGTLVKRLSVESNDLWF